MGFSSSTFGSLRFQLDVKIGLLAHDPEKCVAVFRKKAHAQTTI
jgi:hypothetical protein